MTCDCEGAEKAYVIINPNSPDREQILSLNPPICHETKQKGLLINGQLTTFPKVITSTSTQIISGGIQVDWGGGDVDILTGETWDITTSQTSSYNGQYRVVRIPAMSFGTPGISMIYLTYPYAWIPQNTTPLWRLRDVGNNTIWTEIFILGTVSACLSLTDMINAYGTTLNWQRIKAQQTEDWNSYIVQPGAQWTDPSTGLVWTNGGEIPSGAINGRCGYQKIVSTTKTVTTNTGQTSVRVTTIDPNVTLQNGDCELTVTFADTSTQVLTYPECPTVAPVNCLEISDQGGVLKDICPYPGGGIVFQCGERECPPETCCNPCEGSALNCCYDESGRLIDSFIRRT